MSGWNWGLAPWMRKLEGLTVDGEGDQGTAGGAGGNSQSDPVSGTDHAPSTDPAPAAASADSQPDPAPTPDPDPKPAPQAGGDEWWRRRIDKLTAKNKSLETELAAAKQAQPQPGQPAGAPPGPDFQSAVQAEAQRLAEADRFNRQCAEIADAGKAAFGDEQFNRSVSALVGMIDRSDAGEVAAYRGLIEAAAATGEAPRIIHLLGSDPNEAARIMALPPARMGVELAKMAAAKPDRTVTGAPRPAAVPRGSGGAGAPHSAIDPGDPERADRLSTAEWMARREADQSRWDARGRRG